MIPPCSSFHLVDAHGLELGYHLVLGGNACVVRSRHPAGILAIHARLTDKYVIESIVEHMSHVENTGDIRRRDNDSVRFPVIRLRMEALVLQPIGIPFVLYFRRIVFT